MITGTDDNLTCCSLLRSSSDVQGSRSGHRCGTSFYGTFSGPNGSKDCCRHEYRIRSRENGLMMTTTSSRSPRPSHCDIGNMCTTTTRIGNEHDSHNHSEGGGGNVPVRRPTRLRGRVDSAKAEELVAGLGFNVAGSATSSPPPSSSSPPPSPDARRGQRRRRADGAILTPVGEGNDDDGQVNAGGREVRAVIVVMVMRWCGCGCAGCGQWGGVMVYLVLYWALEPIILPC